jgi:hypothetical protein
MREEAREKKRKENIAESLKRNCDQLTTPDPSQKTRNPKISKIYAKFGQIFEKKFKAKSFFSHFSGIHASQD